MINSGSNNWNILYNSTKVPEMLNFMRKVSHLDLDNMTVEDAKKYVYKGFQAQITGGYNARENSLNNIMQLTEKENPLKYTLHKTNKNVKGSETKEYDKVANKLISGYDADSKKIQGLQLKTTNSILQQIENLPKTLHQFVNYNSVSLPRHNILLDSRNRNISSGGYLSWNLASYSSGQLGDVNTQGELQQIISVSCNAFKFPIPTVNTLQNVTFYKKIRIGISELSNQGIELIDKNYYHIDCDAVQNGQYLECKPMHDWIPSKVIAQISKITLNFYGNTELIKLDSDRLFATYVAGNPTVFTFQTAHGLVTGDLVYIESGELAINDTNSNKGKNGYIIAVLSPTSFEISTLTTVNSQTYVYFASKRLQIQLNFICLE